MKNNSSIRLGYYAHYPTILEPAPGPWGGMEIHQDHPVDAWQKILLWLNDHQVDYVVAVISPKFRDNIYHDWPFHYVCDLAKYPEAGVFPPELVRRHRKLTNQVVEMAKEMNIDMYFTHFNFYAPRGFIETHPQLRTKYQASRGQGIAGHDSCNYMNTLVGNICWSDPDYQKFMIDCWDEFFTAIPLAKGLMITPGEHNQCPCPKCKGTSLKKEDIKAAATKMKLDFIQTFVREMNRLGRDSLVRTWYLDLPPEEYPPATVYLPKYHVFDCFDAPIDPQTEHEIAGGRSVHPMFVQNGENAAQVFWFRPEYWQRIGKTLAERGAKGALIMDNIDWGLNGMTHPATALNLEAFFHYVRHPKDDAEDLWPRRVAQMVGRTVQADVLKALDLLSEFPMNITKIIFLGNEGYTFGPIQPCDEMFAPDPWGVLCRNWTPPDWARGDIGRLKDYWDYLGRFPFESFEVLPEKLPTKGDRCPLQVMAKVIAAADGAIDLLEGIVDQADTRAHGLVDGLLVGAHITREHSTMLLKSMQTALLIRSARAPINAKNLPILVQKALNVHTEALDALKRQIGWINALPHDTLDFRNWLRFRMPEFNSYQAVMFTPLSLMEIENQNLRKWVENLGIDVDPKLCPQTSMPSLTAMKLPALPEKGWRLE